MILLFGLYAIAVAFTCWVVVCYPAVPGEVLILSVGPVLLTAFFARRRFYLPLAAIMTTTVMPAVYFLSLSDPDTNFNASTRTAVATVFTTLIVSEILFLSMRRRRRAESQLRMIEVCAGQRLPHDLLVAFRRHDSLRKSRHRCPPRVR